MSARSLPPSVCTTRPPFDTSHDWRDNGDGMVKCGYCDASRSLAPSGALLPECEDNALAREPLSAEREAEWRAVLDALSSSTHLIAAPARAALSEAMAEVERLRAELEATVRAKQENDERFQLAATEQRDRAEKAEARVAELERAAIEARPPQHSWRVETYNPLADQWTPGSHFASRPPAVERLETANRNAPLWRDGTPVERRIVRETTTYTVEEPPASAAPQARDNHVA